MYLVHHRYVQFERCNVYWNEKPKLKLLLPEPSTPVLLLSPAAALPSPLLPSPVVSSTAAAPCLSFAHSLGFLCTSSSRWWTAAFFKPRRFDWFRPSAATRRARLAISSAPRSGRLAVRAETNLSPRSKRWSGGRPDMRCFLVSKNLKRTVMVARARQTATSRGEERGKGLITPVEGKSMFR